MVIFGLQRQSRGIVSETGWPTKPKMLTTWPFMERLQSRLTESSLSLTPGGVLDHEQHCRIVPPEAKGPGLLYLCPGQTLEPRA